MSLYYRERWFFLDLLVKRGAFFLAGQIMLTAWFAEGGRCLGDPHGVSPFRASYAPVLAGGTMDLRLGRARAIDRRMAAPAYFHRRRRTPVGGGRPGLRHRGRSDPGAAASLRELPGAAVVDFTARSGWWLFVAAELSQGRGAAGLGWFLGPARTASASRFTTAAVWNPSPALSAWFWKAALPPGPAPPAGDREQELRWLGEPRGIEGPPRANQPALPL